MNRAKRRNRIFKVFSAACGICGILGTRLVLSLLYTWLNPQTPGEFMTAGGLMVIAAGVWWLLQVYGALFLYDALFNRWVAPLLRPPEIVWQYEDRLTDGLTTVEEATRKFHEVYRQHLDNKQD